MQFFAVFAAFPRENSRCRGAATFCVAADGTATPLREGRSPPGPLLQGEIPSFP
eukprot:NODE_6419_length_630_cov_2.604131_g5470_i0.p3 GENE.NODE_6419_length_630_cov_2.604131_g5470_i0~~NODE_6419_length_630_cov_2.604131_g5470_i0.p3  ORF type:complete len:54 (+),score=0.14 NODE_6419_length_630_cov_2.604131_g5470_i0:386-547(+)